MLMMGNKKQYLNNILSIQPSNLIGLWDFQEASGALVTNKATKLTASAVDLILNGGFEVLGTGGADVYAFWNEIAGNGAIADETTIVHAGGSAHAAKLTAGASANTYVYQDYVVKPGQENTFVVWARGDGTNSGRYLVRNYFTGANLTATLSFGVTGTDYTQVTFTVTPPAGVSIIELRLYCPAANGGIAYVDDVSVTAITDCTAGYSVYNTTYQQPGPGLRGINYSAKFDGVASACFLGSGGYNALANHDTGSVISWMKVKASSVWTDASTLRYTWHPKDATDPNKYVVFGRHTTNNTIFWRRKVGVAANQNEQTYTFASAPLGWFCMGYSWNISIPQLCGYVYVPGELAWTKAFDIAGVDMNTLATANFGDFNNALLMGGGTNSQLWQGWGSVHAQWAGITLTDSEMCKAMIG